MLSIIHIIFCIVVIVVLIRVAEVHRLSKKLEKIEVSKEEGYSNREIGKRMNRSAKVINNFRNDSENYGQNYKGRTKRIWIVQGYSNEQRCTYKLFIVSVNIFIYS